MMTNKAKDPFGITEAQETFVAITLHKYHLKRVDKSLMDGSLAELTEQEAFEQQVLRKISGVTTSLSYSNRGNRDSHWDEISSKAIKDLYSLGFKTNQDISQYIYSCTLARNVQ
jgi:hypothetical protein